MLIPKANNQSIFPY